ncbi:MAG: hypothetical protein GY832_08400, partial [Chloroflexi bacterium]|nr:hypothetical protein [Chloroflexota bacterium]
MTVTINLRQNAYYEGTKVLDGNSYRLTVHWNTTTEKWYMDVEGLNNTVDIKGIALLCGKDLLSPYGYIELGQLWMVDNSNANEDPNYDDLIGRW